MTMLKTQRFSVTLGLSVRLLKMQVFRVKTQFFIKHPGVIIKRSSELPCLILFFKYFNQFLVVIYVWISSSNSLSQTTGTILQNQNTEKDDYIKYSLILNTHTRHLNIVDQNPIPLYLFRLLL